MFMEGTTPDARCLYVSGASTNNLNFWHGNKCFWSYSNTHFSGYPFGYVFTIEKHR